MQKNFISFIVCSAIVLALWIFFFQPEPQQVQPQQTNINTQQQTDKEVPSEIKAVSDWPKENATVDFPQIEEKEIVIEKQNYKAVFSNKGASVKHWYLKEKNGSFVDLVLPEAQPVLGNFPGSVYEITEQSEDKLTFTYISKQQKHLHCLKIIFITWI